MQDDSGVRVGLVLSAGGLRGAAHVGVLRQLARLGIPVDIIVGVSAGAVVAAYYAGVGLEIDELLGDAASFRGRHLLSYSVNVHLGYRHEHRLRPWCGVIPDRLRQLEAATFDRLHHGVRGLGIVCHDVRSAGPRYFHTGGSDGARLADVVRASASIPLLFPPVTVLVDAEELRLTDGGLSDAVPTAFARRPPLSATHVIVSDCRWFGSVPATDARTVWLRPRMAHTGSLWSPRQGLLPAVRGGEAAVTTEAAARIRNWFGDQAAAASPPAPGGAFTRSCPEPPGNRAAPV